MISFINEFYFLKMSKSVILKKIINKSQIYLVKHLIIVLVLVFRFLSFCEWLLLNCSIKLFNWCYFIISLIITVIYQLSIFISK